MEEKFNHDYQLQKVQNRPDFEAYNGECIEETKSLRLVSRRMMTLHIKNFGFRQLKTHTGGRIMPNPLRRLPRMTRFASSIIEPTAVLAATCYHSLINHTTQAIGTREPALA